MGKDAYWFPHDSNSRGDKKCIRLRRKHGWKAYGIWWAIVEQLRDEDDYKLPLESIDDMCFEMDCEVEIFDEMFTIGLLQKDGDFFYSQSLRDRMLEWDEKKQKRRKAGRLGGLKKSSNAKAILEQNPSIALAKPKQCSSKKSTEQNRRVQNSTEEKRRNNYTASFDAFWKLYPARNGKKTGKAESFIAYKAALKKISHDDLVKAIELQSKSNEWLRNNGAYVPDAHRWLKKSRWEDEVAPPPDVQNSLPREPQRNETPAEAKQRRAMETIRNFGVEDENSGSNKVHNGDVPIRVSGTVHHIK